MGHGLTLLVIAFGGALGAISRYQITVWFGHWFGHSFPYATLAVNIIGSFVMGLLMSALAQQVLLSPYWRPVVAIGFLGALTTFSTFSIDTLFLLTQGQWLKAALNIILHLLLCMVAVTVGYQLLARGH